MFSLIKMNTVLAFVVVLGWVDLSQQEGFNLSLIAEVRTFKEQCVKETGVDGDVPLDAFLSGNYPDDAKFKCYCKCMLQKTGGMDANGNMNLVAMAPYVPPIVDKTKAIAAANSCEDKKGADACETAFNVAKCLGTALVS